ncbi:MAG: hypothetical protein LBP19_02875 [Treponema sp.]|nr:hypothetical protein [Treponema sp.]
MNQHPMPSLITSTGYGNTGSSAGTNILEEFASIKSYKENEFTFAHETDGIADLESSFAEGHRLKTDLAVKRFLVLAHQLSSEKHYKYAFNGKFERLAIEYINSIVKCVWKGWWFRAFETERLSKKDTFRIKFAGTLFKYLLESLDFDLYEPDGWTPDYRPVTNEYYSNFLDKNDIHNFIDKTKLFTANLLQEAAAGNTYNYIMLDQAIPPIAVSKYIRYWTNPKVIIVDRDPRDLYVINKALWGSGYIPSNTAEQFIAWYGATRQTREAELGHSSGEMLFLPFESLVYTYDDSLKKIINFINLSPKDHIHKLQYFNPEISRKNTLIFPQYPDLAGDVKKIEKQLEKYCYPFPEKSYKDNAGISRCRLIQDINDKAEFVQYTGRLPSDMEKYTLVIIFRMTIFSVNLQRARKRRGVALLKSLMKMAASLPILPFDYALNLLFFLFQGAKRKR